MVIVNIIGGLGNQMFQYAAARAVALRKGVPLKLDVSGFASYGLHHGYELAKAFNCVAGLAKQEHLRYILGWQSSSRIRTFLSRHNIAGLRSQNLVTEPSFCYWSGIKEVPDRCYLNGYWQSEKYFSEFADTIRRDFTFRQAIDKINAEYAELIMSFNSVSLHVRRGDYAKNPKPYLMHGLCTLEYYHSAIAYISKRIEKPHFFIFSDDIDWTKSNLTVPSPVTYVDNNFGSQSYNDMRLMSLCKHNIIANSSFSWWGAWLNSNCEKIVVAPSRWFNLAPHDTRDLYCSGWVVL